MTAQPHHRPGSGPAPRLPRPPSWRRLTAVLWWIEHAFERSRAQARPEEDTRVRIFLILAVFAVVFACLGVRAAWSALAAPVLDGAGAGVQRQLTRGDLVDRNGRLLATNVVFWGLYVDPAEVWDKDQAFAQIRRALPEVDARRLRRALDGDRRVLVRGAMTPQQKARVHALGLGGIGFEQEDGRVYPLGGSARHVIGVSDAWGKGLTGAELALDADLTRAGVDGSAVPLSIDLRIQGIVESELAAAMEETGAKNGVALVTNVHTGEILAMASWPTTQAKNLATSGHYEMGSVFKSFTVAAGIDRGLADMETTFDASQALVIGNRRITDFHAQNRVMTLEDVYIHSSNIGTSQLAMQLGPEGMKGYFQRLGLLNAAPLELKESAAPVLPREWSNSTLASLSFGYGIMVTPVQAVAAMGALTNGGFYVPLSIRKGGAGAEPVRVVQASTSVMLLDLMRRNVVRGSGTRADAPGLRVGGKTGSANKWTGTRYDSTLGVGSFAAVFPTDGPLDGPRYAIFVLVDEPSNGPRTGGFVAAPAVGRIADRIAPLVGVERRADRWRTADGEKIPTLEDMERDLG
ncbi:MAG TPA: penicillin-binding protein 2 [Brevundimonas sp.]|uniref:peptidoglycan D,D-transpeptidase FtsI family protein n=1 Tax=Brevundimonas sp. TaxID=1871086 RepID=UPI002DEE4D3D|nr:penicillin-binding protein 2 [Brevundimonas sp.]